MAIGEWEDVPPEEDFVAKAAKQHGIDPEKLHALIKYESAGNPKAQSPTGPQGLTQLSKAAATDVGLDPSQRMNPQKNAMAGAAYYQKMVEAVGPEKAYTAYHDGITAIKNGKKPSPEATKGQALIDSAGGWEDVPDQLAHPSRWPYDPSKGANPPTAQDIANNAEIDKINEARDMSNFVPHDVAALIPLVGPSIGGAMRKFEQTPMASKMVEATKDIPYIGEGTRIMLGQGDSKFDLKAGQEMSKLIAGAGDISDFVRSFLPGDNDKLYKSTNDRAAEQESNDEAMAGVNKNPGFGGVVGSALPYVLSQYALGGPVGRGVEAGINKLASIPVQTGKAVGGVMARNIEKLAAKPGLTGVLARAPMREFIEPARARAAAKALQVHLPNPYTEGQFSRVLGGTALGGLEGGVHYDNTVGQGMLSGAQGSLLGELIRPWAIKSPNFNTKPEQDIIDWHKAQGGVHSPGITTGSKAMQDFESGVRNTRYLKNTMNVYDQEMNIINNRVAAKSMGLPNYKTVEDFGPTVLNDHLKNLGAQYDKLEAGTVARLLPSDHATLANQVSTLAKDFDPEIQKISKTVNSYANRIKQMDMANIPQRNPLTGQILPKVMEGATFKGLRSDLKAEISAAYSSGNPKKAAALKPILQTLDDAVERGLVLSSAGKTTVTGEPVGIAEWKKLNEQTAITHLVKDNALSSSGSHVDPHALHNYFKTNDAHRFHTETGPESMNELYKLAKFGDIFKNTSKTALGTQSSGGKGFNSGKQSLMMKLLQTGASDYLPVIPRAAMHLYMKKGWPSQTGHLFMSGKGFGDPGMYTRALYQGTQPLPSIYNSVTEAIDTVNKEARSVKDSVKKKYREYVK